MARNSGMIYSNQPYLGVSSLRDQKQTKDYISDPETAMQGDKVNGRLAQQPHLLLLHTPEEIVSPTVLQYCCKHFVSLAQTLMVLFFKE